MRVVHVAYARHLGVMERKRKLDLGVQDGIEDKSVAEMNQLNPYTGRPYSKRYHEILDGRKGGRFSLIP